MELLSGTTKLREANTNFNNFTRAINLRIQRISGSSDDPLVVKLLAS